MKKILVVLVALAFPMSVWAMDIPQGKYELSGTTSFDFSNESVDRDGSDIDVDTITLDFNGQYYIQKNLALGVVLTYADTDIDGVDADQTSWMIGPQATYNISIDPKLSFFVNGALLYANYDWGNTDADGFGFRIGGGVKYFLVNNIALVGQLKYTWLSLDHDIDVDGLGLGVGLSVIF